MAGKPKPGFFIAVAVIVLGLIGFAAYRFVLKKDDDTTAKPKPGDEVKLKQTAEATGGEGITTFKEYEFVAMEKLPPVKGTAGYKKMSDRTVRFAINVWAGWAPIIFANGGMKAGKVWKTPGGKDFKVELVLIDEPITMRDAFAAGDIHIGWATVDMLPLLVEGLQKDSRTMPRIFQQVDWSNGGDGIVVREGIKSASDLRGKKVAFAANSPSHYFLLNVLINSGVQPSEIEAVTTKSAFGAATAFNSNKDIAGVVSWAPDIYKLSEVKGNKMLVNTLTANKLIADVWYARADFAKDHPDVVEGLVRGIFDAMVDLEEDANKQAVAKQMGEAYSMPASEAGGMLADAHWTNYAENREFFLNQNNPTNFEQTYGNAQYLYKQIRAIDTKVPFNQIMDNSVIKKLAKEEKYASQKDTYTTKFAPAAATTVGAEAEILTKTVVIHFFPNSHDIDKKVTKKVSGKDKEVLYDPNAPLVVEEVGKLAGQFGAARIVIEGHTDSSMKGRVPEDLVRELARNRANAVKGAVLRKFKTLQPNQFQAKGVGWARPADASDPKNHAKNRRVEVKVYPAEVQ